MTEMGKAMMGTGEATGEDRALMAAQNAIQNPLLDEVSLKGAKAVLVNVTGGLDADPERRGGQRDLEQVDPEANIIFGAAFDPSWTSDPRRCGRHRHGRARLDRRHRAQARAPADDRPPLMMPERIEAGREAGA